MKREEKTTLARQRILDAALEEFSQKGYEGASLSTVCSEKNISKGIVYHHSNPLVVEFGRWLLISQVALYPAFGLCYMMTITFQTIGAPKMGLFLSVIRQGLFYVPAILLLPGVLGFTGICLAQPAADVLTVVICVLLIGTMKRMASKNMAGGSNEGKK